MSTNYNAKRDGRQRNDPTYGTRLSGTEQAPDSGSISQYELNHTWRRIGSTEVDRGNDSRSASEPTGAAIKSRRTGIKIGTFNMKGRKLNGRSKFKEISTQLLLEKITLLIVQETRVNDQLIDKIKAENPNITIWNSGDHSNKEGIALIGLNKNMLEIKVEQETIIAGRLNVYTVTMFSENIKILAIYSPNELTQKVAFWKEIRELSKTELKPDLVIGDFNFVENPLDRFPVRKEENRLMKVFREVRTNWQLEDGWRKANPKTIEFTFDNKMGSYSRIDRIYIRSNHFERTNNWKIGSTLGLSDHNLVTFEWYSKEEPDTGPGYPRVHPSDLLWPKVPEKLIQILVKTNKEIMEAQKGNEPFDRHNSPKRNSIQLLWKAFKDDIRNLLLNTRKLNREKKMEKEKNILRDIKLKSRRLYKSKGDAQQLMREIMRNKETLAQMAAERRAKAQINAQAKYASLGQKSTKYWYGLNKTAPTKSIIYCLQKHNGEETVDTMEMNKIAIEHHGYLQNEQVATPERDEATRRILEFTNVRLDESEHNDLNQEIDVGEIKEALKKTANGSAPGLDGLP